MSRIIPKFYATPNYLILTPNDKYRLIRPSRMELLIKHGNTTTNNVGVMDCPLSTIINSKYISHLGYFTTFREVYNFARTWELVE